MYRTHSIDEAKKQKGKVRVAGWVHKVVDLGKMCFLVLRDWSGKIQVTGKKGVVSDEVLNKMKVGKEWVLSIEGTISENPRAPGGIEIIPEKIEILNEVRAKLPVDPTEKTPSDFDTLLTYRYLDLRKESTRNAFIMKSVIVNAYREAMLNMNFVEIHPPTIIGAASEGGAEVFPVQYFENKAFLAQSPQLYKQLAVIGGMERVFSTMPVFRAEKHNTPAHLNETIMLDAEIAFVDEQAAMDVLERAITFVVKKAEEKADELGIEIAIDLSFIPRITYDECIDALNKKGRDKEWGSDISREEERALGDEFGNAFFIYAFPTELRAFYSLPYEENPKICRAFDLILNGLEVSSGAQRIHKYDMLKEALIKKGLDPEDFSFYLDAFKFGAPPHAGFGIGLERLCMQILGIKNIREVMLYPRDRTRLCP
jgi:aspartyl-tRNA synthetase